MGMGLDNRYGGPAAADFVVVVNGKVCRPCARLYPLLQEAPSPLLPSLSAAYVGQGLAVLKRAENEGMDFAAHNITLTWLAAQQKLGWVWFGGHGQVGGGVETPKRASLVWKGQVWCLDFPVSNFFVRM